MAATAPARTPARTGGQASPARFAWLARLFGFALALYLRLVAATCRLSGAVTSDQVVLAFWHEFNLAAFVVAYKVRRDLHHASFSTAGFRGIVITTLFGRLSEQARVLTLPEDFDAAAGRRSAVRLARLANDGYSIVVTPDGPFGPYRVAKPGALIVARASRLPIQAWAISARPSLRLTGRWDRQLVPLPFGRLRLVAGPRLRVAPGQRLGRLVTELQGALDRTTARADHG